MRFFRLLYFISFLLFQSWISAQPSQNVFLDLSFGTDDTAKIKGFDGQVNSIAIQNDNRILVGGKFKKYNGVPVKGFVALTHSGEIDQTFPMGGFTFDDYP